ncbi:MAG: flagellar biosynthesis repressor FlbT [Magnetospiraceae bacterium]
MPLKIQIKQGKKIIVNGAVLENVSGQTVALVLMNEATVLRDSDILTPDEAVSPASRVYYAIQIMYLFPEHRADSESKLETLLNEYEAAAPSAVEIIADLRRLVSEENYYPAMKRARDLIGHETGVLKDVEESIAEKLSSATPRGESQND